MKDSLSKIKRQVADDGHGEEKSPLADDGHGEGKSPVFIDPNSRSIAVDRLNAMHEKEQRKLDQGFVKKRVPINGGYGERWVLPE